MTYTNEEYAELAIKANEEGKLLKKVDGNLILVDPEPIALTNAQIVSQNKTIKNALISEANEKIAILQDIIDLDMCESNESEQLKQWKKYRVLLSRIDTSLAYIEWPQKPN